MGYDDRTARRLDYNTVRQEVTRGFERKGYLPLGDLEDDAFDEMSDWHRVAPSVQVQHAPQPQNRQPVAQVAGIRQSVRQVARLEPGFLRSRGAAHLAQ